VARRLGEVANGIYAARSYLERRGTPTTSDLGGHDLVDYDESYVYKPAISWFRQRTRGGRPVLRVNGSHGFLSALQAGMGVGPLPCWLGDSLPDLARVLPREGFNQELWLVLHQDLRHVARMRAVCEFFVHEMRRESARLLGRVGRKRVAATGARRGAAG